MILEAESILGFCNFILDRLLQIRGLKRDQRERIADLCDHVANRIITGRDRILDAYEKKIAAGMVQIPSELNVYAAALADIAPTLVSKKHSEIVGESARIIDELERMSYEQLSAFSQKEIGEKLHDVNQAAGQFAALAQLIRLM
jgi:hypothetical protein